MAIVHKLQVPNSSGTNVTHTLGTVHYIVGTGTTAGTWLGTDSSITTTFTPEGTVEKTAITPTGQSNIIIKRGYLHGNTDN